MDQTPLLVFVALFGAVLGSFGNVLIFRVPAGKSINGRSHCRQCGRTLTWFELIPVFSYLFLLGRCRTCRTRISPQYPLVEGVSAMLFVSAFLSAPDLLCAFFLGIALWLLLLLAVIDGKTGTVPDALSIPFILASAGWALFRAPMTETLLVDLLLAMVIGAGFFGLQWILSRGKWVGSGDIFLAAGIGALLGSPALIILAVALSYIIGSVIALLMLSLRRTTLASDLAFGPFLALAGIIVLFQGEWLLMMLGVR